MNRQKLFLIILLCILAAAIGYAFLSSPRLERVTKPLQQRIKPEYSQAETSPLEGIQVRLDLLKRKPEAYDGYKRNIFGPAFVKTAPKLPPPPPEKVAAPVVKPPVLPPLEIKQPVPRFTFLGFLELDLEKTVFLSLKNEIFVVKKGKPFGKNNEFQVVELTPEKVEIRQADDPQTITVSIANQQAAQNPLNRNGGVADRANGVDLNNQKAAGQPNELD